MQPITHHEAAKLALTASGLFSYITKNPYTSEVARMTCVKLDPFHIIYRDFYSPLRSSQEIVVPELFYT